MDETQYTNDYWEGVAALHEGRLADALASFERVPKESACFPMALGNSALALFRMTRYAEAEAMGRRTLATIERMDCPHPPARVQYRRDLALSIGFQGRWVEAIQEFETAFRLIDALADQQPELSGYLAAEAVQTLNGWGQAYFSLHEPAAAIGLLRRAREISRRHPEVGTLGQAEVLTNLAAAHAMNGDPTTADLALQEAFDVVGQTEDWDQWFRIAVFAVQLGSSLVPRSDIEGLVEAGARDAKEGGRPGVAVRRYCVGLALLCDTEAFAAAGRMAAAARRLEPRLDPRDILRVQLRDLQARLVIESGQADGAAVVLLLEGAHLWYEMIAAPLVPGDFQTHSSRLHDHFRTLAAALLRMGRVEEAFLSFEAGRALAHAADTDRDFLSQVIRRNPFDSDGVGVNLDALRAAQRSLSFGEAAVVLTVCPPTLVTYIVDRDKVEKFSHTLGSSQASLEQFDKEVRSIPRNLEKSVALKAVPDPLATVAKEITRRVDGRTIRVFVPYDILHIVPWRALLRNSGLPWTQFPGPIGFSFLFWRGTDNPPLGSGRNIIALGYGTAGAIDLQDEARSFAAEFGDRGQLVLGCTGTHVTQALETDAIVLVSCHGTARVQGAEVSLILKLSDGDALAEAIFPVLVASPLVILSACDSGVYQMAWSDYPIGAAPELLRRGARYCIAARFPVNAEFAAEFFKRLAHRLAAEVPVGLAFAEALGELEAAGSDRWRHLACLELLGRS